MPFMMFWKGLVLDGIGTVLEASDEGQTLAVLHGLAEQLDAIPRARRAKAFRDRVSEGQHRAGGSCSRPTRQVPLAAARAARAPSEASIACRRIPASVRACAAADCRRAAAQARTARRNASSAIGPFEPTVVGVAARGERASGAARK